MSQNLIGVLEFGLHLLVPPPTATVFSDYAFSRTAYSAAAISVAP